MRKALRIIAWTLGTLLLLLAIVPFLVPVPPLTGTVAAETLAGPRSQFVDVRLGNNTINVHIERAGSGEQTLILLHGFLASTFSWREVIEPLAEEYTVIAFDRPAFGLTQRPMRESWGNEEDWSTLNPYSPVAQIELTVNLMDALAVENAILVGNSAGGNIAMRTALNYPTRVEALVLFDPAVYTSGGGNRWTRWLSRTPQMQRIAPLLMRRIKDWGREFGESAWHDPNKLSDEIWAGYTLPLQTEHWDRALWEQSLTSGPSDLVQRLSELTLPTLVITGDDDRIVPTEQSVRLAEELPNAELLVIPQCGHAPQEECPEPALQKMKQFLDGLPKSTRG